MAGGKRKLLSETIFVTVFILFYLLKISTHLYRYQMLIKCISNAYQQYIALSVIQSVSPQDDLSAVGGLSSVSATVFLYIALSVIQSVSPQDDLSAVGGLSSVSATVFLYIALSVIQSVSPQDVLSVQRSVRSTFYLCLLLSVAITSYGGEA